MKKHYTLRIRLSCDDEVADTIPPSVQEYLEDSPSWLDGNVDIEDIEISED